MIRKLELKESQVPYATAFDTAIQNGETVILERGGQPVAVLMPIRVYRTLQTRATNLARASDPEGQNLEQDRAAYLRLKDELLRTHPGLYVGFKDGEFVDSDADRSVLIERMYDRFGYAPIYVKRVEQQERTYRVPGPRRVR